MTPAEYRVVIDRLGLSQVKTAKLLGIDPRSSRRYASGEVPIPEATAKLLRFLVQAGVEPAEFDRLSAPL